MVEGGGVVGLSCELEKTVFSAGAWPSKGCGWGQGKGIYT